MNAHRRSARLRLLVLAGAISVVALGLVVAGGSLSGAAVTGLLYLLPAILLCLLLLGGRYPGERVLQRLRRPRPASTPVARVELGPCRDSRPTLRGGRLIAARLAGRGPPLAAVRC